jgi:hypothetical protein
MLIIEEHFFMEIIDTVFARVTYLWKMQNIRHSQVQTVKPVTVFYETWVNLTTFILQTKHGKSLTTRLG